MTNVSITVFISTISNKRNRISFIINIFNRIEIFDKDYSFIVVLFVISFIFYRISFDNAFTVNNSVFIRLSKPYPSSII